MLFKRLCHRFPNVLLLIKKKGIECTLAWLIFFFFLPSTGMGVGRKSKRNSEEMF